MITLAETLGEAATKTAESMPRLRKMKNMEEYWVEINRLENGRGAVLESEFRSLGDHRCRFGVRLRKRFP